MNIFKNTFYLSLLYFTSCSGTIHNTTRPTPLITSQQEFYLNASFPLNGFNYYSLGLGMYQKLTNNITANIVITEITTPLPNIASISYYEDISGKWLNSTLTISNLSFKSNNPDYQIGIGSLLKNNYLFANTGYFKNNKLFDFEFGLKYHINKNVFTIQYNSNIIKNKLLENIYNAEVISINGSDYNYIKEIDTNKTLNEKHFFVKSNDNNNLILSKREPYNDCFGCISQNKTKFNFLEEYAFHAIYTSDSTYSQTFSVKKYQGIVYLNSKTISKSIENKTIYSPEKSDFLKSALSKTNPFHRITFGFNN